MTNTDAIILETNYTDNQECLRHIVRAFAKKGESEAASGERLRYASFVFTAALTVTGYIIYRHLNH